MRATPEGGGERIPLTRWSSAIQYPMPPPLRMGSAERYWGSELCICLEETL